MTPEQIIEALTNMSKDEFVKVFGNICDIATRHCYNCRPPFCDNYCDTSCSHCPCDDCALNVIK